jgi:predicted RNA-binding Zn ribbon-like protein
MSSPADQRKAAAIVELLNSRPHATPLLPDTLTGAETAAEILRPFGLPDDEQPTAEQLDRVRKLRGDLMAVVDAGDDADAAEVAWARLDQQTADVSFRYALSVAGRTQLRQVAGDPVIGGIIRALADLQAANLWSRIRSCANGLCSHVFYDTTRSRTQRWDSYETCGNRVNVAAYRARSRPSRPAASSR